MTLSTVLEPLATAHPTARRWVVAYSGGMDSHVLLHLCVEWQRQRSSTDAAVTEISGFDPPRLTALHINHGVHADATRWAEHCLRVCNELGVVCINREVDATAATSEAALRTARYAIFESFCENDDLLLLAHHRDDQAETILLRLLRGAGARGLSGIPCERPLGLAWLCRPLLALSRAQIRDHAVLHGLHWIEDPGNASDLHDRNFLRNRVMPLLSERWPGAQQRMAIAADHLRATESVCAERAAEDLQGMVAADGFGQAFLDLERWRALAPERAANVLRYWLGDVCQVTPEAGQVATVVREVIGSRPDAEPRLRIGQVVLTRFHECLYALPADLIEAPPAQVIVVVPGQELDIPGFGRMVLEPCRGIGIKSGKLYEIRFRHGGERCAPAGRPHKPLKKWLQEMDVPPWLRGCLPLLYVDGKLAAVADLFVCDGFAAGPAETAIALRVKR